MEILRLDTVNAALCASVASEVLKKGGVVLYPTDTLYGLGVDAFSNAAVDKLYQIKGREGNKPIHAIVADLAMAERYAFIDHNARALAKAFLPGPLTLILKKKEGFDTGIGRGIGTIGIRIPLMDVCIEMARAFDGPITTTSANKSGAPHTPRVLDIEAQLYDTAHNIDLVIDAGELPPRKPSTIVDLSSVEPVILREGEIVEAEIWEVLRQGEE